MDHHYDQFVCSQYQDEQLQQKLVFSDGISRSYSIQKSTIPLLFKN